MVKWDLESLEVFAQDVNSQLSDASKSISLFYLRWNDKEYNARLLCSRFKNPFMGSCMAKGLVVEKIGVESKQPNSAVRKGVRVMLKKNGKKVAAFVPWDGCLNYLAEND